MADLIYKRLDKIDKEVEDTKMELKITTEKLHKKPKDPILLDERSRLVQALRSLNTRQENLEKQLGAVAAERSAAGAGSLATDVVLRVLPALGMMVQLQMTQFEYSASKASASRQGDDFKARLQAFYCSTLVAQHRLRCMLLNVELPATLVTGPHLFKYCWKANLPVVLGLNDINDPRNGLLLFKPLVYAFNDSRICFMYVVEAGEPKFKLRLLDLALENVKPRRLSGARQVLTRQTALHAYVEYDAHPSAHQRQRLQQQASQQQHWQSGAGEPHYDGQDDQYGGGRYAGYDLYGEHDQYGGYEQQRRGGFDPYAPDGGPSLRDYKHGSAAAVATAATEPGARGGNGSGGGIGHTFPFSQLATIGPARAGSWALTSNTPPRPTADAGGGMLSVLRPENLSALRDSAMGLARSSVEAVREVEGLVVRLTLLQHQLAQGRRASQAGAAVGDGADGLAALQGGVAEAAAALAVALSPGGPRAAAAAAIDALVDALSPRARAVAEGGGWAGSPAARGGGAGETGPLLAPVRPSGEGVGEAEEVFELPVIF